MSNFEVVLEEGVIRTTSHPYQLHFLYKTKVDRCEDISIDMLGLSLTTIGNICTYSPDYEFLVGWYLFCFNNLKVGNYYSYIV
jgi:hypothetical protein